MYVHYSGALRWSLGAAASVPSSLGYQGRCQSHWINDEGKLHASAPCRARLSPARHHPRRRVIQDGRAAPATLYAAVTSHEDATNTARTVRMARYYIDIPSLPPFRPTPSNIVYIAPERGPIGPSKPLQTTNSPPFSIPSRTQMIIPSGLFLPRPLTPTYTHPVRKYHPPTQNHTHPLHASSILPPLIEMSLSHTTAHY